MNAEILCKNTNSEWISNQERLLADSYLALGCVEDLTTCISITLLFKEVLGQKDIVENNLNVQELP